MTQKSQPTAGYWSVGASENTSEPVVFTVGVGDDVLIASMTANEARLAARQLIAHAELAEHVALQEGGAT